MNERKKENAARLFRAIGELDDQLLEEALHYAPPRRQAFSRVLLLAATLTLSLGLLVATLAVTMRQGGKNQAPPLLDESTNASEQEPTELDELLCDVRHSDTHTTLPSSEEIPFFDGKSYLVWQYADSEEFCISRALTEEELSELHFALDEGEVVGEESPTLSCRVWVVYGNGSVISPYLRPSKGNVASAALFAYEAEQIPSDAFVSCISDILNES